MENLVKQAEAIIVEQMEEKLARIRMTVQKVKTQLRLGNYEEMNAQLQGLVYLCDNAFKKGEELRKLSNMTGIIDLLDEQFGHLIPKMPEKEEKKTA